jgi:hypothetical protein
METVREAFLAQFKAHQMGLVCLVALLGLGHSGIYTISLLLKPIVFQARLIQDNHLNVKIWESVRIIMERMELQ